MSHLSVLRAFARPLIVPAALLCGLISPSAYAQTVASDAWVRATVPAQKTGGAYLSLRSPDAARLVSASSPVAARVELHTMQMKGNMMSMREAEAIALPAAQPVSNFHIMLVDLKAPLLEGQKVPLSLVIEHAGGKRETVQVEAPVKPLTFSAPAH